MMRDEVVLSMRYTYIVIYSREDINNIVIYSSSVLHSTSKGYDQVL